MHLILKSYHPKKYSIIKISKFLDQYYKKQKDIEIIQDDSQADFFKIQNTNKCVIKIFPHYSSSKIIIVSLIYG